MKAALGRFFFEGFCFKDESHELARKKFVVIRVIRGP
jgi:hypothetical protein